MPLSGCKANLFDLLIGSGIDTDGFWVLTSVPSGVTLPVDLLLSDDPAGVSGYVIQSLSLGEVLNPDGDPTPPHIVWWNPDDNDYPGIACNTPGDFVFTYEVNSACGDPPTADITWTLNKLCLYDDQEVDVCPNSGTKFLLTLLRDAGGHQDIPRYEGTWTYESGPGHPSTPSGVNLGGGMPPDGLTGSINTAVLAAGTYVFRYSVTVLDSQDGCVNCTQTVDLTVNMLVGSSAGGDGSISTCLT